MTVTLQRLPWSDTPHPLGRHEEFDDRSRPYAFAVKSAMPLGITTHWSSSVGPLNQGELGSCTGQWLAQWLNTDYANMLRAKLNGGKPFTRLHAEEIYSLATVLDRYPGRWPNVDTGSSVLAAAKAAKRMGLIGGYTWLFSWRSLLASVERRPLGVGTLWTYDMFEPVNGLVRVGDLSDSNIAGGHAYLCCGVDYEAEVDGQDGVLEFRNSWGNRTQWPGAKPGGYFAITFRDFRMLQEANGETAVPMAV